MQASNAGLLTYDRTLTSGALFHWLSAGRPVLAPNLGTIPAYVVDGWNGWLYVNADDLRARLACAMSASVEEETGLADNARKTAGTLRWGMWEGE